MIQKGKNTLKKIGMFLGLLFLFLQQTGILIAAEPKRMEEMKKTEETELSEEAENKGGVENIVSEEYYPYFSDMDELSDAIQKKLSTSEENFILYVPDSLVHGTEFDGLLRRIFPDVRTGNYYSSTIYSISISSTNQDGTGDNITTLNIEVKRTDSKEEQDVVLKIVKEIALKIEKSTSNDYDKIKQAHDYLVQNVEYVSGYNGAYSALYLGKAVCNGYAAAFQLIMDELEIPCMMINSDRMNHVWNCVYLDGYWYNVDVTWDDLVDGNGKIFYQYFLKSQDDFYGHGEVSFSTALKSFSQNVAFEGDRNGWKRSEDGIYYYMDGRQVNGWLYEDKKWYYFGKDGAMKTGWIKSAGKWYFLGKDGVMETGWIRSAGKWYFLEEDGAMKTGWIKSAGKWYFLGESGAMKTGWIKNEGTWYYLGNTGAMVNFGP